MPQTLRVQRNISGNKIHNPRLRRSLSFVSEPERTLQLPSLA